MKLSYSDAEKLASLLSRASAFGNEAAKMIVEDYMIDLMEAYKPTERRKRAVMLKYVSTNEAGNVLKDSRGEFEYTKENLVKMEDELYALLEHEFIDLPPIPEFAKGSLPVHLHERLKNVGK